MTSHHYMALWLWTVALFLALATTTISFAPCPAHTKAHFSVPRCLATKKSNRSDRSRSARMTLDHENAQPGWRPFAAQDVRAECSSATLNAERRLSALRGDPRALRRRLEIAVEEQRFDDAAMLKRMLEEGGKSEVGARRLGTPPRSRCLKAAADLTRWTTQAKMIAAVAREDYAAAAEVLLAGACGPLQGRLGFRLRSWAVQARDAVLFTALARAGARAPRFASGLVIEHRTTGVRGTHLPPRASLSPGAPARRCAEEACPARRHPRCGRRGRLRRGRRRRPGAAPLLCAPRRAPGRRVRSRVRAPPLLGAAASCPKHAASCPKHARSMRPNQ